MILVGLVVLVSGLVYLRARIAERIRREEQARNGNPAHPQPGQAPQLNRGLFPPEGDPERPNWVVLR
jgi:SEL1 protein